MRAQPRLALARKAKLPGKARQQPEHRLQAAVCQWLRVAGVPGLVFFHPANEGKRGVRSASLLKEIGLLPGASDLILAIPPDGRIAALEFKADGKTPTPEQYAFLELIRAAGGHATFADNIDDALFVLDTWGVFRAGFRGHGKRPVIERAA